MWTRLAAGAVAGLVTFGLAPTAAAGTTGPAVGSAGGRAAWAPAPRIGAITDISHRCSGQNAEVEQAIDPARGYVYEEWMGCHNQIAFARSTDRGANTRAAPRAVWVCPECIVPAR